MQAIRTVQRTSFPKVASQARLLANQRQTPSFKFSSDSTVSNFPKGKGVSETRAWLEEKGFKEKFVTWEADALLGADKEDILSIVPDKIARLEAKITEIESSGGIYADATDKEKRDAILANQTALNILLQSQQGKLLMVFMLCFHTTILICLCVLFAFY